MANTKFTPINVTTATAKDLVAWYNANSGSSKKLDRFKDHKTAVRRVTELQTALTEMHERATGAKSKGEQKAEDKSKRNKRIEAILVHMERVGTFIHDVSGKDKAASRKELGKMNDGELEAELATWETPAPAPEVVAPAPGALPPPAPLPPVIPPPAQVELVKEPGKGKRYVSKTDPDSKYHLRDRSDRVKPVDYVRCFCNDNPSLSRKEVIAALVEQGVNRNTAATQFSLWKKAQGETSVKPGELMGAGEFEGSEE